MGRFKEARCECVKFLLSCRVSNLHFEANSVDLVDFHFEIYGYGGEMIDQEISFVESLKNARLSDAAFSYQKYFNHVIVFFVH